MLDTTGKVAEFPASSRSNIPSMRSAQPLTPIAAYAWPSRRHALASFGKFGRAHQLGIERKAMSKPALCATSGASPTNASKSSATAPNNGLSLDDAMTVERVKTGCLGIDDDLTYALKIVLGLGHHFAVSWKGAEESP
jgi:hypothetical protein